jgi:hypothetical protein
VTFRGAVRTVPLYVTVQDHDGRLVSDLQAGDFEVRDNGRPADITSFSSDVQPITMVLLVDMSSSMSHRHTRVRDSMLKLVDALLPTDRVRLGAFGEEVLFTPFLTSDKEILRRMIYYDLWPGGPSLLWYSMWIGLGSLDGEQGRRVLLVATDGDDSCEGRVCTPFRDVEKRAIDGEFLIYAVGIAGAPLGGDIIDLAKKTGGGSFTVADDADLAATFTRVAEELHRQYVMGFTPVALDGRRHKIEVRMRRPGMTAVTRKDYLASR